MPCGTLCSGYLRCHLMKHSFKGPLRCEGFPDHFVARIDFPLDEDWKIGVQQTLDGSAILPHPGCAAEDHGLGGKFRWIDLKALGQVS